MEVREIEASGPIDTDERVHPDDRRRIGAYRGNGWELFTVIRSEDPPRYRLRKPDSN